VVSAERLERLRAAMPELPDARKRRFVDAYALPEYDASQLTQSRELSDFFEAVVTAGAAPKAASNWMMGEVARMLNEQARDIQRSPVSPEDLAGLLTLIDRGTISGAMAKDVFDKMVKSGQTAGEIVAREGLAQIDDDGQIEALVADVLTANADAVAQFRGGKGSALGFLVGQVMKATAGKANPKRVNELLKRALAQ
jgi:aspartyl-tRNA(Asn)/glutamyl-tRNA(Gln) amidotransferase subunit B